MKKTSVVLLFCIIFTFGVKAQKDSSNVRNEAVKVYLDCDFCDITNMRDEVSFVNYVRDPKDAQVHILVTSQNTGGGGNEYTFTFLGRKKFLQKNDTLVFTSNADNTQDEIRKQQLKIMKLGLVYYVAHSPNADLLKISYTKNENPDKIVEDRWNSWVFSLGTSGYFNGDSNYSSIYARGTASAIKVTNEKKIELNVRTNYDESKYKIDNETVTNVNKTNSIENLYVWSLTNHWSAGYNLFASTSSYNNYRLSLSGFPAVEYNIFPYSESTHRQLRVLFKTGYVYNFYNDTTIYNKLQEGLFKERLSVAYETTQKWGSINTALSGNVYLYDLTKNSVNLYTSLNIRIVKGLSFRISSSVSVIHDQISLPLDGATREDILLRQEQLSTQYSYWGSAGITYTFGSIYNNIVNPRFGD